MTTTRIVTAVVGLAAVALPGCGGSNTDGGVGSGLEGIYAVTSNTRNEAACDVKGPDVAGGFPYFRLLVENRAGSDQLSFYGCNNPDMCNPAPSQTLSGIDPDGDGWRSELPSVVSFDCMTCDLGWSTVTIQPGGAGVRIEVRGETGAVPVMDCAECTNDLAEMNRAMLVCTSFEVLVGEPL